MRLALLALVVAAAACYRSPAPAAPTNQAAPPSAELVAKDPLAFLPRDSELVIDLDLGRLRASPLWQSQIEPTITSLLGSRLAALRDACGIDFAKATTRFTTGMKKVGDSYAGVMVVRGPDSAATMSCIEHEAPQPAKVTRDGDALLVATGAPSTMAVMAVGRDTLVVLTAVQASRAMVADAIAAGTPLRSSPAFMALFDAVPQGASLVTIANGASPAFEPMRSFGIAPQWVVVTATIESTYAIAARVTMKDAADAQRLATMIQSNAGALRAMVDRLDVVAAEAVVTVDVAVTEDQARRMLAMMGTAF